MSAPRIAVPNIEWRLLEDTGFGYVSLQHFSASARADLDEAFTAMNVHSLAGLVLDLRGNPGGLLDSALEIASAFIEEGPVAIQDYGDHERILNADGNHAGLTLPLALLVDGRSASASELVAGALQDRGRATIIGEQTFGKGTMQEPLPTRQWRRVAAHHCALADAGRKLDPRVGHYT